MSRRTIRSVRAIASLAVALCCAWLAVASSVGRATEPDANGADAWHEGVAPDGSFRVRGPAPFEPLPGTQSGDAASPGIVATVPGAFNGVTKYVARCRVEPDAGVGTKQRIEAAVTFWSGQAPLAYQRPVMVGAFEGVELELSDRAKTLRVRVVPTPRRTCTLFVQWSRSAKPREEKIRRFLDSFVATDH